MKHFDLSSRRPGLARPLLSGVGAALVIAFGSLLPASQAAATVVYSGPVNIAIPVTTAGVYLNVVTGVASATPAGAPGWDVNLWGTGNLFAYANNAADLGSGFVSGLGSSTSLVDNLAPGTVIGAGQTYARTGAVESSGSTALVLNSSDNYLGFRFLNESTGVTDYGWLRVSLGSSFNASGRTILGYAYDNAGATIGAGVVSSVPEPTTFVLTALGVMGLGLARLRHRR